MKVLLLAGEESGLLYAKAIRERLGDAEVRGYDTYGFKTSDLAVIGFVAVLRHLFYFLRVKRTMQRAIDTWKPDVVCTVDYPGMNLRLAAYAKKRGIRAVHVVCPQVWAWKQGRIPKVEAALDRLCCFFPFEPKLFRPGFATFVGHPLVQAFAQCGAESARATRQIALLPGSRGGEIDRILPVLLDAAERVAAAHADVSFVIPAANVRAREKIAACLAHRAPAVSVEITQGKARELLHTCACAAVASGTATLEAALAHCPTVLVYKVSAISAAIARRIITGTRFLGLANIIWDKCGGAESGSPQPMEELLQEECTSEAVARRLNAWLDSPEARDRTVAGLDAAMRLLIGEGDPLGRIADIIKE